jgi:hypothetical protein
VIPEGFTLLRKPHCPELGHEMKMQFMAAHVIVHEADFERCLNFLN